uniref:NADH-ubiquinone oxidoreductase chain 2 n=2 Tax=Limnephilus decipiens TaxID=329909 RepID=A0A1C9ZDX0_9NEOP|nr:NADH dehydrogenase subunit 2 [Limnephilus decipiens]BAQ19267.1 NADH dehydrogenase subunit 2 [Limnephilus decipiens]
MNNYFNSTKILFLSLMMISTIFSISSLSMINIWMGMEINLISFIPIMINKNNNFSSESMMSYFLVQSISSANFLFSFMLIVSFTKWFNLTSLKSLTILFMMNISLLMKLGAAPFHFWFPKTMKGLNWMNCFILSTWQKILPMITLSYCFISKLLMIIASMSVIIGSIMGLMQTSLQMILTYSSISHIGWMLISLMLKLNIWLIYLIIYSFLNYILMSFFKIMNMYTLNQIYSNKNSNFIKYFIMLNLLSLSGLPPLLGFMPKWLVINLMINNNLILITFILIMMSLINMYFYIRITYSYFMLNFFETKFYSTQFNQLNLILIFTFFSIMGLMLIPLLIY